MDFHLEDLIVSIINIMVLAVLLRLILWKPVSRFLAERSARVRSELESAEKALEDAEALKLEYKVQLDNYRSKGEDLLRESRVSASCEADKIIKEAEEEAGNMLREARKRIEAEKRQAIDGARHEVAQIAANMAVQILRREISAADSASAAEDFFHETR